MYSNSYCSYKFAPKQEKIGQSSHKEYSNNILKYLEFTAIINACTKKSGNLLNAPRIYACGGPFVKRRYKQQFIKCHKFNLCTVTALTSLKHLATVVQKPHFL